MRFNLNSIRCILRKSSTRDNYRDGISSEGIKDTLEAVGQADSLHDSTRVERDYTEGIICDALAGSLRTADFLSLSLSCILYSFL